MKISVDRIARVFQYLVLLKTPRYFYFIAYLLTSRLEHTDVPFLQHSSPHFLSTRTTGRHRGPSWSSCIKRKGKRSRACTWTHDDTFVPTIRVVGSFLFVDDVAKGVEVRLIARNRAEGIDIGKSTRSRNDKKNGTFDRMYRCTYIYRASHVLPDNFAVPLRDPTRFLVSARLSLPILF